MAWNRRVWGRWSAFFMNVPQIQFVPVVNSHTYTSPHYTSARVLFTCYLVCHLYVYIVQSQRDKSCSIKIITSCLNLLPSTRAYFFTLKYVRERLRLFQSQKAKNFLPVAATFKSLWKEMCLFVATPLWGRGGNPPSHLEM